MLEVLMIKMSKSISCVSGNFRVFFRWSFWALLFLSYVILFIFQANVKHYPFYHALGGEESIKTAGVKHVAVSLKML